MRYIIIVRTHGEGLDSKFSAHRSQEIKAQVAATPCLVTHRSGDQSFWSLSLTIPRRWTPQTTETYFAQLDRPIQFSSVGSGAAKDNRTAQIAFLSGAVGFQNSLYRIPTAVARYALSKS
jgi:hypothetical protein